MDISFRDFVLGRNLDRLTQRQQAAQYGLTSLVAVAAAVAFRWLADLFLGWDANLESTLNIAGGMVVGVAIITVIRLIRASHSPRPSPEPDLHLTGEMSRRIR